MMEKFESKFEAAQAARSNTMAPFARNWQLWLCPGFAHWIAPKRQYIQGEYKPRAAYSPRSSLMIEIGKSSKRAASSTSNQEMTCRSTVHTVCKTGLQKLSAP